MSKRRKPAQPNLPTTEPAKPVKLDEQDVDGLTDEERAEANEKLRKELLDKLMQLNAERIASMDPQVLQHWLSILDSAVNAEQQASPVVVDDADNIADDISPLVSMAGALADLDRSLENFCANAPPFLGLPSGQTMSDFLGALLAGDEDTANKVLQRHCDGAFYSALKELQRRESATKSDEDATTRATRLTSGARVAVASGALVYARFFTALAVTIHTAELHTSVEAGEHGDRAKA